LRICVADGGKYVSNFMIFPSGFGKAKKVDPGESTGSIRVELDPEGKNLPLHSVIAVRAPSRQMERKFDVFSRQRNSKSTSCELGLAFHGGPLGYRWDTRELLERWTKAMGKSPSRQRKPIGFFPVVAQRFRRRSKEVENQLL